MENCVLQNFQKAKNATILVKVANIGTHLQKLLDKQKHRSILLIVIQEYWIELLNLFILETREMGQLIIHA